MSKRSRRKRRERCGTWRCLGCGMVMHRQVAALGKRLVNDTVPGCRAILVHVCGGCKRPHFEADGGGLRDLSPAERFDVELHAGRTMRHALATTFAPTDTPTGSLIIALE